MPAAAGLALSALIAPRGQHIDHDLHLVAPDRAARGESIPLRAQLYGELNEPEGPRLVPAQVDVEIQTGTAAIARTRLRVSYEDTLEGSIRVPPHAALGDAEIIARAAIGNKTVTVARALAIVASAIDTPSAPLEARPLPALQRFAPGPLRTEPDAPPPSALFVRVAGGACVPERECRLYVHVGEPAAAVRIAPTPSVTPASASAAASQPTGGVIVMDVVTHGPEAELRVVAERGGVKVATRAFRLPIALGAGAMRAFDRLMPPGATPSLGLQGDQRGCIADGFLERRWRNTAQLDDCRGSERLPFAPLASGLWRVQLRRDPFASASAAAATFYVRHTVESDSDVLARLARAVAEREPDDALAQRVSAAPEPYTEQLSATAGYLLAALDGDLFALPQPISGYPRALARQEATNARVRRYALFALALCGLSIGLIVAQRGFAAASEAGRVMEQAGEAEKSVERQRLRMTLRVLATVTSLLLAFAAIAAYVIARGSAP